MFHVPAHKQTNPAARPAQRVNPVGAPSGVVLLSEYIARLQRRDEASRLFHAAADALVARGGR